MVASVTRASVFGCLSATSCRVRTAAFSAVHVVKPPMSDCGVEPINVPFRAPAFWFSI